MRFMSVVGQQKGFDISVCWTRMFGTHKVSGMFNQIKLNKCYYWNL